MKELKYYAKLNTKKDIYFEHIPKFYGLVKTNLAIGIILDYIDNSIILNEYIKKYGITRQLM